MLKVFLLIGLSACLVLGNPLSKTDEYDEEYEEEEVCLTSSDSEAPNTECVFPFTFNNFTYNGCPTDPNDESKRWCSTKTDENGVHITGDGNWGHCTPGCQPEVFPDELLIATDANDDTQTETCDYTACNGLTFKVDIFDTVETYGQCQYPAGENGAQDDYFCFVNANSACKDKVPYGDEEEGLFLTTLACKDENAPLPRTFGNFKRRSFSKGFYSSNRRSSSSKHGSSYGSGRYSKSSSHSYSSPKKTCHTTYKQQCTYDQKQECKQEYKTVTTYENKKECRTEYKDVTTYENKKECKTHYRDVTTYEKKQKCEQHYKTVTTYENKRECETHYRDVTTYENRKECKTVYKTTYQKQKKCETTYTEECNYDDHSSGYGNSHHDSGYDSSPRGKREADGYGHTKYVEKTIKCKKIPHEHCNYVSVPKQVPEEECNYVKVPKTTKVPEEKCHYVKVPKHSQVPEQKCRYIDVPKTSRVPEEKCHYVKVPKHSRVPEQKCHYNKVPKTSRVPEQKCKTVKVPKCSKVPEKKCTYTKTRYGSSHKTSSYGSSYVKPW